MAALTGQYRHKAFLSLQKVLVDSVAIDAGLSRIAVHSNPRLAIGLINPLFIRME